MLCSARYADSVGFRVPVSSLGVRVALRRAGDLQDGSAYGFRVRCVRNTQKGRILYPPETVEKVTKVTFSPNIRTARTHCRLCRQFAHLCGYKCFLPRETRGKKRISKARFAGKFNFFDKLRADSISALSLLIYINLSCVTPCRCPAFACLSRRWSPRSP